MAILDVIRMKVRVSGTTTFDENDIQPLIDAAKLDLIKTAGLSSTIVNSDTDALVIEAIATFCKARFGHDRENAERFEESYQKQKVTLSLLADYQGA